MRDNHEGMPELIRAFEKDGHYFLIIEIDWEHQKKRYQFGVLRKNYLILQRILETRTFDMMPGLKYRYFYAGSSHPLDLSSASMFVRIELGRDAITREFEIPKELHANLLWFTQLKSIEDARYLEIADD
jgi:hypothetical protein